MVGGGGKRVEKARGERGDGRVRVTLSNLCLGLPLLSSHRHLKMNIFDPKGVHFSSKLTSFKPVLLTCVQWPFDCFLAG